ncbi:MAG: hypothetical protein MRERV_55c008 [Mycoplasmataceae bacterium RV_VA103A]|nr:MAG: hypothetical protein MRERV_55c008 [Mycoplasmataceae bacterium RV_VA103A]
MPRILYEKGYKFYIYLNESPFEPAHVHVLTTDMSGEMKVWLNNLDIAECYDIPTHEWSKILKIIKQQKEFFIKRYYELNKQNH